jgi:hypothetical protein
VQFRTWIDLEPCEENALHEPGRIDGPSS